MSNKAATIYYKDNDSIEMIEESIGLYLTTKSKQSSTILNQNIT